MKKQKSVLGEATALPRASRAQGRRSHGDVCACLLTCKSIEPLPSTSYMRNAHWSFSLGVPADVTSIAQRNSYRMQHTEKKKETRKKTGKRKNERPLGLH